MIVAVISDTHLPRGTRRLPDLCVARLRAAEAILHAGDFVLPQVLDELEALGPPVYAVCGNVDSIELARRLPATRTVALAGATIGMVHDAGPKQGRLARLRAAFPDADAVVYGHSHVPHHERSDDGFQIFNPGSPTEKRRAPAHTLGIATIDAGAVHFEHLDLDRPEHALGRLVQDP